LGAQLAHSSAVRELRRINVSDLLLTVIAQGLKMNAQRIKVLVVEDDPVYAGVLQDMLRPVSPFEVTAVGRFDEALRQLGAVSFHVVLLDLCLPDRMGLATYRDLRDPWPALPIVVLTRPEDEKLALQTIREGVQHWLVKGEF